MADTPYISRRALWLNRLSDEVVRNVSDRIRSGELPAGEPLPDRGALAAEFVTSLGVIDRAIETLLAESLVARDDDGLLRVCAAPRREGKLDIRLSDDATRADVLSILELRIGVESEAAALAAERRSEAQLAAIRSAQAGFVAAAEAGTHPAQADFQFHRAISEASGNPYIGELTEHLGPLLIPRMRVPLPPGGGAGTRTSTRRVPSTM